MKLSVCAVVGNLIAYKSKANFTRKCFGENFRYWIILTSVDPIRNVAAE